MGENKLLMKYDNKYLVEYTLDIVSKCNFNEKIIVTQYEEIKKLGEKLNFKVIINEEADKGQSESIKLGVKNASQADGYMFFVGDQPFINKDDIKKLIEIFKENKDYIVIPRYKESLGNPVIYPSKYKKDILKLQGDKGGKSIIKSCDKIKYVDVLENTLFDIDNIDDYNKFVKRRLNNERHSNS